MLETLFHIAIAFFVLSGVVYCSIFSWLKLYQADDVKEVQPAARRAEIHAKPARI